jgi:hypothetical protein
MTSRTRILLALGMAATVAFALWTRRADLAAFDWSADPLAVAGAALLLGEALRNGFGCRGRCSGIRTPGDIPVSLWFTGCEGVVTYPTDALGRDVPRDPRHRARRVPPRANQLSA